MQALQVFAGPRARAHLLEHGLRAADIRVIPAAAGGPKGLILNPLDQFIFGPWLGASAQTVHLLGASIGAWRMATACFIDPVREFERLAHDYIHQQYAGEPGKRPTAQSVTEGFSASLDDCFAGREGQVLSHARYRLHIFTSRGRHILGREGRLRTPLGYAGAFAANLLQRRAMGVWLERVVFSDPRDALPVPLTDYRSRVVSLDTDNFRPSLLASCSIPFWLQAVHDIPGAPPGAYWDGGITDYHLHLQYAAIASPGLVLYPHFQSSVIPGWLDKGLKRRHRATSALDNVVLLAPRSEWVATLPNAKLPDRNDFAHYASDLPGRIRAWQTAVDESQRLADEFAALTQQPSVQSLPLS